MNPDIRSLIKEVLEKGYLMSLATQDESGLWVADVIYIFDEDFTISWMSNPNTRHSKAIAGHSAVAGSITVSGPRQDNVGIQFSGAAQKIDGARHDLAVRHYAKRGKPQPLPTDDVLQGGSWYQVTPIKIDLIYEQLFGFTKQHWER